MSKVAYIHNGTSSSCAHAYLLGPIQNLIRTLPRNQRVLDLGCGSGWLSHEIAKLGCEVHGIDSSESGITLGQAAFPDVQFSVGDVETDNVNSLFKPESFDVVISTEVVEHVYSPRQFVENAFYVLKPSGHFILSTPYHGYFKNVLLALTGKMDRHFTALWDGGHIKFWSPDTLRELLAERGFTRVQFIGAGRVPFVWKSMICVAHKP